MIVHKGNDQDFKNYCISPIPLPLSPVFERCSQLENYTHITGISTLLPNEQAVAIKTTIQDLVGDSFQVIYTRESKGSWLEVVHKEVRKDLALRRLWRELDISLDQVVYFGDNFNDREVLRIVGQPILVANAQRELKDEFPKVISSVDQEGVAHYLDEQFLCFPSTSG